MKKIHEFDENMLPDSEFIIGSLDLIVKGNVCRVLDTRRTSGFIEEYFPESAMFRWRITNFEDKGKYWDVPAEGAEHSFQFEKNSKKLPQNKVKEIKNLIQKFKEKIYIKVDESIKNKTEKSIFSKKEEIKIWLQNNSKFFKTNKKLNLNRNSGILSKDLLNYMDLIGFLDLEIKTSENLVLNPSSGEWVKGMEIVLAEMGIINYSSTIPRTKDIFNGIGNKNNRKEYLINRLAFVRAFFELCGYKEILLYRGMSSQESWITFPKSFISYSFSLKVAKAFFEMDKNFKNSYLLKRTFPIEKVFMTFIETKAMNNQYNEKEALIFYSENEHIF